MALGKTFKNVAGTVSAKISHVRWNEGENIEFGVEILEVIDAIVFIFNEYVP